MTPGKLKAAGKEFVTTSGLDKDIASLRGKAKQLTAGDVAAVGKEAGGAFKQYHDMKSSVIWQPPWSESKESVSERSILGLGGDKKDPHGKFGGGIRFCQAPLGFGSGSGSCGGKIVGNVCQDCGERYDGGMADLNNPPERKRIDRRIDAEESVDPVDQLIDQYERTGLVIVQEEISAQPVTGTHQPSTSRDYPQSALELQEMHRKLGVVLPQLHAIVTSSAIGEERHILTQLFQELQFAHTDLANVLSIASQVPAENLQTVLAHYARVYEDVMSALDPYSDVGRVHRVTQMGPYKLKGASLYDSRE
jgi:hypothetical protein